MAASKPFFPGIHALRAIAAVMVVVEHAATVSGDYSIFGHSIIVPHFSYGRIGVILFFAISGFVIALQRTKPIGEFLMHRLLRIYPGYWLAMVMAAIALASVGRGVGASASSILLYPSSTSSDALAIPYWTLAFEMTFYAIAAVAFAFRLSDRALTIAAFAWIAAVNILAPDPANADEYAFPGASILLSSAVQVFPMGLICGIHFGLLRRFGRSPYLVGAALGFVGSFPFAELSTLKVLTLGASSACLIVAIADTDLRSRVVSALGDASYGLYLLHFPAMLCAVTISPEHGLLWFAAVGLGAGGLFGLIDHRLHHWLVGKLRFEIGQLGRSRGQLL